MLCKVSYLPHSIDLSVVITYKSGVLLSLLSNIEQHLEHGLERDLDRCYLLSHRAGLIADFYLDER